MAKTYGARTKPANMTDKARLAMEHAWNTQNPGADDFKDIADDIELLEDDVIELQEAVLDEGTGLVDRVDRKSVV
jgi:hypothetical protein